MGDTPAGRPGDAALLAAFDPQRPDTFAPIVAAFQVRLVTFASRMLGGRAEGEEVAQDAFLRAFRHLQRRPPESWKDLELSPWLYRITLNLCHDRAAARPPEGVQELPDADRLYAGPGTGPEMAVLRLTIERALGQLPLTYRPAVVLRYVDQLSYQEIAHILNVPLGTAKAWVHRGTRLLRTLLEEDDV